MPVAAGARPPYVTERRLPPSREATMADIVSTSPRLNRRPLIVLAVAGGALLAATIALWAHYGTAVFFEMIRAGFAACL